MAVFQCSSIDRSRLRGWSCHTASVAARFYLQQRAADFVGFGDEHPVRPQSTGPLAFTLSSLPERQGNSKSTLPLRGSRPTKPAACEARMPTVGHRSVAVTGTAVAGELVGRLPADRRPSVCRRRRCREPLLSIWPWAAYTSGGLTRRTAADVGNQQVVGDDGGAANAEKVLHDAEFLGRINLPDSLAVGRAPTQVQLTLSAEQIDSTAIHHRRAAGSIVVAEQVVVVGRDVRKSKAEWPVLALATSQAGTYRRIDRSAATAPD